MTYRCKVGELVMWIDGPEDLIGMTGTTVEQHPRITGPDGRVYEDAWLVQFPTPQKRPPRGITIPWIFTLDKFLQPIRPPAPDRHEKVDRKLEMNA